MLTCGTQGGACSENEAEGGELGRESCIGGGGTAEPKAGASILSGAAGSRTSLVDIDSSVCLAVLDAFFYIPFHDLETATLLGK